MLNSKYRKADVFLVNFKIEVVRHCLIFGWFKLLTFAINVIISRKALHYDIIVM